MTQKRQPLERSTRQGRGGARLCAVSGCGIPVAVPLEHDRRPVIGLDHGWEVRPKRPRCTLTTREFAP
jgi:hypothetical protein